MFASPLLIFVLVRLSKKLHAAPVGTTGAYSVAKQ